MSANIRFISAGAGSGKTYSLTQKLEALLSSKIVKPAGVIATTFTKLAAGELKERVRSKLIESGQLAVANQMEQSLIGTVNGVCGELLRRFAFEAGMPPDQQVVDESQGDVLFYQAMEKALADNKPLMRQMNATCDRLQIVDQRKKVQLWRAEVKSIVDSARANNQTADDIRHLGKASADQLLAHFPAITKRNLDGELLEAINHALAGIDTELDSTNVTRNYLSMITGVRARLSNHHVTWSEWISLSKKNPGAKSRLSAKPVVDIAMDYAKHKQLHKDVRFFTENAFAIAADSLNTYQQLKAQKGLIDFVDQEQRLYRLLDNPSVKNTLREELQLLMVDEFQDTSPIQLALFLKLSRLAEQVIWVGDIKQSIYGFRGSDPTLMSAVVNRVIEEGNPPEILQKSWRSRPELVAYTNSLFVPAFNDTLKENEVALKPARAPVLNEPAVELWRLVGGRKSQRAQALAVGLLELTESDRTVIDKESKHPRPLEFGDIAILCRTHANLGEIANALADVKLPIQYKRPGLLTTPEGYLALACLRRMIDPLDTLASAEITSLTSCQNPETWIAQRINYLMDPTVQPYEWLEDDEEGPLAKIKAQRSRLPHLTPVEALRVALEAGGVREAVFRWGPTEQRSQHRLNNLSALLQHAEDYIDQCTAQSQPASTAGLLRWLQVLAEEENDTQASGGDEDAIQLVTHHGAKGLEWPVVIAMDLDAKLKPRLWGLSVLPSNEQVTLEDPLANRTLRYWPKFFGGQTSKVPLLEKIEESTEGLAAMEQELQESKRLLYVSLTRPRDCLIITMSGKTTNGPWMDTLGANWMLPDDDQLTLPDGIAIPTRAQQLEAENPDVELPDYSPTWLVSETIKIDRLPLRLSPSSFAPDDSARIGEIIELGERLEINGEYDPAVLGAALHAVIATKLLGQKETDRVLKEHGMHDTISAGSADECTDRLLTMIEEKFSPLSYSAEYPISYTTDTGQVVTGWIDLLLETEGGFVVIDHKASPRPRKEWEESAIRYSGQLKAYSEGIERISGKTVIGQWVHFAVTGGLVQVV